MASRVRASTCWLMHAYDGAAAARRSSRSARCSCWAPRPDRGARSGRCALPTIRTGASRRARCSLAAMPTVLRHRRQPGRRRRRSRCCSSLHDIRTLAALIAGRRARPARARAVDVVIQDMNFTRRHHVGRGGRRAVPRDPRAPSRSAGDPADRVDASRDRGRAGQGRRGRLPGQAVGRHQAAGDGARTCSSWPRPARELRAARARSAATQARALAARYDLRGLVFAIRRRWSACVALGLPGRARRRAGADHRPQRHRQGEASPRSSRPTPRSARPVRRRVNCGALPAELIEAELFGAEAGAYTGANKAREGSFEAADGGTLFLDEIGNLPLAGQMKLLRVLETGKFERLGSNRTRQVKVRVISATNADLTAMIRDGTFREDLYYRLNVIEMHLPPLAERGDDIAAAGRALPAPDKPARRRRARRVARARVAGQRARAEERAPARGAARDRTEITAADLALRRGRARAGDRRRARSPRDRRGARRDRAA